jgi:O-6-methylguanine DNA methyltransferase
MKETTIVYAEMESPIGPLVVAATERGICHIDFGAFRDGEPELRRWSRRWLDADRWVRDEDALRDAVRQLSLYFAGERKTFDLPLDLRGTPFQLRVWNALLEVGYGRTASYKEIGRRIGAEKAVRAVGGANNRNPVPIIVPCHRIVGSDGSLVGYGGGLHIKSFLLKLEESHS